MVIYHGTPTYLQDPGTGAIRINPAKIHVKPYWLTTEPREVEIPPAGVSDRVPVSIDTQGHYEVLYIQSLADGPYTVLIEDPAYQRTWMNREIHIDTIGGIAGTPFLLPESYFLNVEDAGRRIFLRFRNLDSASVNRVRFAFFGRRIFHRESPEWFQRHVRDYYGDRERTTVYFLTTDRPVTLPQGASGVEFDVSNTDEADTEFWAIMAKSDGPFEFTLRERSTNRLIMNDFIHSRLAFGDGRFPFPLRESYILERNYRLVITFNNLLPAENNIFVTLAGRRLYYYRTPVPPVR